MYVANIYQYYFFTEMFVWNEIKLYYYYNVISYFLSILFFSMFIHKDKLKRPG